MCSQHHIVDGEIPFKGDPFELIDLIKSAKFVISDSFHAVVLAIEYGVNFWAVERQYSHAFSQSERLLSILKKTDLRNRFIEKDQEFNIEQFDTCVSFENAETVLQNEREIALAFLDDCLKE